MPNMDKLKRIAEEKAQEALTKYEQSNAENPTSAQPGALGKLGKLNEGLGRFIGDKTGRN